MAAVSNVWVVGLTASPKNEEELRGRRMFHPWAAVHLPVSPQP